ncbi:MAG: PRTRC system protein E [Terracidiphilus sp.]|jgi:PRTRC genetic system protein E
MFKELVPILRNRAVLMTATALDDDQIRVNVVPKKMKDGDHDALTTPLSVTGTAEELDAQLGPTLVGFVASHLQMKNALEKAKADMDAATKAAQAETRAKSKTVTRSVPAKTEILQNTPATKPVEPVKPVPQKSASLFDMPTPATTATVTPPESDEDPGFAEIDDDEPIDEGEELDDAA